MIPLLSIETKENGHSSVSISNDTSVYDYTKKVKIITRFSFVFQYNSNNIVKFSVHSDLSGSDVSTTVINELTLLKCNVKI
jgi:hypothetical protein